MGKLKEYWQENTGKSIAGLILVLILILIVSTMVSNQSEDVNDSIKRAQQEETNQQSNSSQPNNTNSNTPSGKPGANTPVVPGKETAKFQSVIQAQIIWCSKYEGFKGLKKDGANVIVVCNSGKTKKLSASKFTVPDNVNKALSDQQSK